MVGLIIEWGGQRQKFDEPGPVTVGRDPANSVTCDHASVSRAHGRFESVGGQWTYVDLGSKRGSFIGNSMVTRVPIDRRTLVHLGELGGGVDLAVSLAVSVLDPTVPPDPGGPVRAPSPGGAWTPGPPPQTPQAPLPAPPQAPQVPRAPGPSPMDDHAVRLRIGTQQHAFAPPGPVIIGRDPGATVFVDNPLLSRAHARLVFGPGGWTIEDLGSKRGTWVDGEQVARSRLSGTSTVWLGPPDAGEKVVVVAPGETKKRRTTPGWLWPVAAAAAVIVVVFGALAVIQNRDTTGDGNLDALKAGTVFLAAESGDKAWSGTGTVIDSRGLILTNAHVAVPSAPGQAVLYSDPATFANPEYLTVSLTGADDEPAKAAYRARPVASDGWLDLAVLEVYADADGNEIDRKDLDLDAVELGDSDQVKTGDPLRVLGFPGAAETEAITVTSGVVAGFGPDEILDERRGWINSDADIRSGNSGGLAADREGRIIGIPTQQSQRDMDQNDRARPINLAKPLIEAARTGESYDEYTSIEPLVPGASMTAAGWGNPPDEGCSDGTYTYPEGMAALKPEFDFAGMTPGTHAALVLVPANAKSLEGGELKPLEWTDDLPASGCYPWLIELDQPLPAGAQVKAVALLGPSYQPVAEQTITIGE